MRRAVSFSFCLVLVLSIALPVGAAVDVRPPALLLLTVPVAQCEAPNAAAFDASLAATGGEGWELVGAPHAEWTVQVDADRAAAMGVTTAALREMFVAQGGDSAAGDGTVARDLVALTAPSRGGTGIPLTALATTQRGTAWPIRLTLDGTPVVVAAAQKGAPSAWSLAGAGAALAAACGAPLGALDVVPVRPKSVRWRVSYRTPITDADLRWSRARMLDSGIAATRGGGRTLGVHRESGGAVWGIARGDAAPEMPPLAGMKVPGFHSLVQHAHDGRWRRPLQSVVRFKGPADRADEIYAAAKTIADAVGSRVNVLLTEPAPPTFAIGDGSKTLDSAKLSAADVELALYGLSLRTADGEPVSVVLSPQRPRAEIRLVGADGGVHLLPTLGTLQEGPKLTARTRDDGTAVVYLGVPTDAAVAVATTLAANRPVEPIRFTILNWALVPDAEANAILDWWAGQ